MKQSKDKNLNADTSAKEVESTAEAQPVRTFIDDIARLKRENKLTQKDISQINPNIIDKIRQINEKRKKGENSDDFYQKSIKQEEDTEKQEGKQFTQGIYSSSSPSKDRIKPNISRLEEITRNIESKYFSEETDHPKPTIVAQQETIKPKISEIKIVADKLEEKKEETMDEKIEAKKKTLTEAVSAIQKEEESLKTRETEIEKEKDQIEMENKSRRDLEVETERQENELRKQKNETKNSKERQELEKKRQSKEDERQRIEQDRWNTDQNIANFKKQIEDIKKQELILEEKKARNEDEIQKLERKQLVIRAETEKLEIIKKLADTKKVRAELETEWKDIFNKTAEARDKEVAIIKRKNIIEAEIQTLETQEHKATDPKEIHKTEEDRWKKDKELRDLEEENLVAEEKKSSLEEFLIKIETKCREVLHIEKEMLDKATEIDRIISASEQDIKSAKQP